MKTEDVLAFVISLAHKEAIEVSARVVSQDEVTQLRYQSDLEWPWPREFNYQVEYFGVAVGANKAIMTIRNMQMPNEEHIVNLFHNEPTDSLQTLGALGYERAWISTLLGRSLDSPLQVRRTQCMYPTEVNSASKQERFNSLPGISNSFEGCDGNIHNFYTEGLSGVVAKGQLVYVGGGIAYASDIFTDPIHRKQGHCDGMMIALEKKAKELGAQRVVLAPGRATAGTGLYERYGYTLSAERAVLIPRLPTNSRC